MRQPSFTRSLPHLTLLCVFALSGCEGCQDPVNVPDPQPADTGTLPVGPGDPAPTDTPDPGPGVNTDVPVEVHYGLAFEGTAPTAIYLNETASLRFSLKDTTGAAVAGEPVHFVATGNSGILTVANVTTGNDGMATVIFRANAVAGSATITASHPDAASDAATVVNVSQNPIGRLVVNTSSQTRIPTARIDTVVYSSAMAPSCLMLADTSPLPTADFQASATTLPGNHTFEDQPHANQITVLSTAYSAAGQEIGQGCQDGATIVGGTTTTVSVVVTQLETVKDGDYDVLMHMSLGQALPEPYDTYINTSTAVLSDPAGFAVYTALFQINPSLVAATYQETADNAASYAVYTLARGFLETQMQTQMGQSYDDITTIGGDLRNIVTDFEVGARFGLTQAANNPNPEVYNVVEQWNDLVFEWSYGCAAGDLACSRRPVQLTDTNYAPVSSEYGALIQHRPDAAKTERFIVMSDPHNLSLRYGAIMLIALNEVVFPNLPGGMAGNSLSEVLQNIVSCADVGQAVADALGGVPLVYEGLCISGVDALASSIVDQVLQLEVGAGDPNLSGKEQNGVLSGGTFYLVDANADLATELVEDFEYVVGWNDPANPSLSQQTLAPITGDGRLAAAACNVDADCNAGQACVPIAHYLKVAAVEMDCVAQVGAALGEATCTADSQCGSGICAGEVGSKTCFSACSEGATCGTGFCGELATTLNLDSVMMGLGDAPVRGCMVDNGTGGGMGNGMCFDTCQWANDGACDDGGAGSDFSVCDLGTDCGDCGSR